MNSYSGSISQTPYSFISAMNNIHELKTNDAIIRYIQCHRAFDALIIRLQTIRKFTKKERMRNSITFKICDG